MTDIGLKVHSLTLQTTLPETDPRALLFVLVYRKLIITLDWWIGDYRIPLKL